MTETTHLPLDKQALRMRRFLIAGCTYLVGLAILSFCTAFGLLPAPRLGVIAAVFACINLGFWLAFRLGWNLRFTDPSLTQAQVCVAATAVALILVLGEQVHFTAVPFYSSLFVFAMLQLRLRELVTVEGYVLATYGIAFGLRIHFYGERIDLRIEGMNAALVVLSSVWYALAASYISRLRARLRSSVLTIEKLASRDALTDLWNRRHIDALLDSEMQRHERLGGVLCVCLIDLDHFKSINDRFGHLVGDAVLKQVAQAMATQLRGMDSLGRFGGEEFMVLLPGTALPEATACAERLRRHIAGLSLLADGQERVTVSIGLADCRDGDTYDTLVARVDAALYEAKHGGRNRVAVGAAAAEPALH